MLSEATPLTKLLPAKDAKNFATSRGLETVGDLLAFWPRRYRGRESDLGELREGKFVVAVAEVKTASTRTMRNNPRKKMLQATITDGKGELDITFFNSWGHDKKLVPGARGLFAGTVSRFRDTFQLTHPGYTLLDDFDSGERKSLIPIYLPVGKLPTWNVTETVRTVLDLVEDADDVVPDEVLDRRNLLSRIDALRGIHTPDSWPEIEEAQRRLRYEEAFLLQLVLARRRSAQLALTTRGRSAVTGGILDSFDDRLPFTLTEGQQRIGAEIADDLARETPMHRLLQGEVGSGKTLVALRAMLAVVDAGGQAALLAPTEVLAQQHHRSITRMLGDLAEGGLLGGADHGTRVALLTGSMSSAERRATLLDIASGQAGIAIGTHALLQDVVQFADLALVVVDEQHRFGVEQRDALRNRAEIAPHMLVMTATPIPRTVAMTVFGDLEVSTLTEVPAGRTPVTTHVALADRPRWMARVWQIVRERLDAGELAYVVCPRIDPDDANPADDDGGEPMVTDESAGTRPPLRAVLEVAEQLAAEPALRGAAIGVMHGRLTPSDKDRVMTDFTHGRSPVLVSTTVIEVGVDVPAATVMVIFDADRFGISQLHQLRGRVGRGNRPGTCFLVTSAEEGTASFERLTRLAATTDGFELAQLDLETRSEGDVLGASQSGRGTSLRLLRVVRDADVIARARADAEELVGEDPTLETWPGLAAAVRARLAEVDPEFLERA